MSIFSPIGVGNGVIVTAGQKLQLPMINCRRVVITALDTNQGMIVVGDSSVVANPASSRNGVPLLPTFSQVFFVSSLNQLWIDATNSGDGFVYYYEIGS